MALTPSEVASESDDRPAGSGIELFEPEDVLGIGLGSDILIVDDDAANLVAYEAALSPLGRAVVLARSGMEALATVLAQDFALILLDVTMPGMSGLEAARLIRQRPRCKGTPIVFITGVTPSNDVILEAYEAGARDFVVKPVLPEILRAKVGVYLQLQERTQRLLRQSRQLREVHQRLDVAEHDAKEREAALATARRLEKLQEVTAVLADARTPSNVAAAAVRLGTEAMEASAAIVWFVQADGSLVIGGSRGIPESRVEQWQVIAAGAPVPANRVLARMQPVWVENEADYARESPETLEEARAANRVWAFVALPLIVERRGFGVLVYSYEKERAFSKDERSFLLALARACEQALERARLFAAEAEARRNADALNLRKDEFLAMLGHELRNPLAVMSTALELIKFRDGTLSRELSILDRQVAHLTHVVGDLVVVSRITQGKISLFREAVELATAVGHTIDAIRAVIERHGHRLRVNVPDNALVDADRHRLDQVLANLLTNAAIYTPDGGEIEVVATVEDTDVRLVVRDNGRGIPADLLPKVFDLFVQGERARAREEGGLGIGLTLVKTIVDLHGGAVEAFSDGAGTGSTFTVRWPRASSRTRTARIPPASQRDTRPPLRVLIVDDNADAADVLAELVRHMGCQATVANDSIAALEAARDLAPQVALLDIGLPEIDGFELARRLRSLPTCATTVLIAVTGYGQPEDRARSEEAGFSRHLVKPVDATILRDLLALLSNDVWSSS